MGARLRHTQVEALPQYDCRLSPTIQPPTVAFATKIKPTSAVRRKPPAALDAAAAADAADEQDRSRPHPFPAAAEAAAEEVLPRLHSNKTATHPSDVEFLDGVVHLALGIPTTTSGTQLVRSRTPTSTLEGEREGV